MPRMGSRGANLQKGEVVTLKASSAVTATAGTNGTAVYLAGERRRYIFLLTLTAAATDVDDTLDVYIDWSLDNSTYYNGGHFTQILGTGADSQKFYMVFDPSNPGTAVIDATSDAAAGAVRPALFGAYVRARWVVVNPGAGAASFTFSVIGYAL